MPRSRNTFSSSRNSSFVESRPGISTTSGGRSSPAGRRRFATTRPPSSGASMRSAPVSSSSCAFASAATARSAASRRRPASTIQTNFAKWKHTAARAQASPALRRWPLSSARCPSSTCLSAVSHQAPSHSSQVSTRAVVVRKSL